MLLQVQISAPARDNMPRTNNFNADMLVIKLSSILGSTTLPQCLLSTSKLAVKPMGSWCSGISQ